MPLKKTTADAGAPKAPRPRRSSGRPTAAAAVGREVILKTTIRLLKTRTPEQLSILEIALATGVTRALVRYYFGDLKGLLREVTEHLMRELQDRMEQAVKLQGGVAERVYQRLILRLTFMHEHPHFERLALSEIYHFEEDEGAASPADTPLRRTTRRGLELTRAMAQDDEKHTGQVDARFIHLAILSVSAFLPTARPLLVELFGEGPQADRKVEQYLRFMSQMLANAMDPSVASPAAPKKKRR